MSSDAEQRIRRLERLVGGQRRLIDDLERDAAYPEWVLNTLRASHGVPSLPPPPPPPPPPPTSDCCPVFGSGGVPKPRPGGVLTLTTPYGVLPDFPGTHFNATTTPSPASLYIVHPLTDCDTGNPTFNAGAFANFQAECSGGKEIIRIRIVSCYSINPSKNPPGNPLLPWPTADFSSPAFSSFDQIHATATRIGGTCDPVNVIYQVTSADTLATNLGIAINDQFTITP